MEKKWQDDTKEDHKENINDIYQKVNEILDKLFNKLNSFDAVLPRIGASQTSYGTAIVRQFEMMGDYYYRTYTV